MTQSEAAEDREVHVPIPLEVAHGGAIGPLEFGAMVDEPPIPLIDQEEDGPLLGDEEIDEGPAILADGAAPQDPDEQWNHAHTKRGAGIEATPLAIIANRITGHHSELRLRTACKHSASVHNPMYFGPPASPGTFQVMIS